MKIKVGTLMRMIGALGMEQKIEAVKLVRDECEVGLKQAKEFVDMFSLPCGMEEEDGMIDNLSTLEIMDVASPGFQRLIIDEALIFDTEGAAECPIDLEYLTEDEREGVVERVIELVLDSLQPHLRKSLKEVLYNRFTELPEGVKSLTMEMLNDKYFHI